MSWTNIRMFLGGLGMFFFGMHVFEDSIKNLTTKTFKRILRKFTNTKIKAILTGTFSTAVLQSSNVVSLIVLAFVGAGVINLTNAIGVIIGANIGTTFAETILGVVGLTYKISIIAFPIIAIGGIGMMIFERNFLIKHICRFLVGFGFLFLGLSFMKDGLGVFVQGFDINQYLHLPVLGFFFLGLILTTIIQSGGATFIIVLTLAGSGILHIEQAIPIIFGSYLGATITAVMGSLGRDPVKKQVALSHVSYNVILIILGFIFFNPIVHVVENDFTFGIGPVFALSVFYVLFKVVGAMIFYPFIGGFKKILQKLIPEKKYEFNLHIEKIDTATVPELAIDAMKYDAIKLMKKIFKYNLNVFDVDESSLLDKDFDLDKVLSVQKEFEENNLDQQYVTIKAIEEKLITFGLRIKATILPVQEVQDIDALYRTIASEVSSAKYIKDIGLNVQDLHESENSFLLKHYADFRKMLVNLYQHISLVINGTHDVGMFTEMVKIVANIKNTDKQFLSSLSKEILKEHMDSLELAGLINVNRYISLSCLSLISALKDLFLTPQENKIFENLQEI